MTDTSYQFLIQEMEAIDRKITKLENDVVMMNKQIGKRISEIRLLKEKYEGFKSLLQQKESV